MPPSPFPNSNRGDNNSSSSSSSRNNNEDNKSSWLFSSWFENDNTHFQKQIHENLNAWEEEQEQLRQQQRQDFLLAPFFLSPWGSHRHPSSTTTTTTTAATAKPTTLQEELQDFFEIAGLGRSLETGDRWGTSTISSSSSSSRSIMGGGGRHAYQISRRDNPEGVQLDVTFPETIPVQDVKVSVLEESPSCLVQWQVPAAENHGAATSTTSRSRTMNFQDQARLGSRNSSSNGGTISCERLVASISQAHNRLTLRAPREPPTQQETSSRPRRMIPIQEPSSSSSGDDKKKE